MEKIRKMNILVLGASGAGKSTLIKAVSGANILVGVGEGVTDKIDVYESDTWPLRFIDTKGFEYNIIKQRKTIKQIKKYTKEQLQAEEEDSDKAGIDAVWYCVEGTSRRTFSDNIELMNKAIKGWKNVPVFAVITKSYSEPDIEENKNAIAKAFANAKKVNLQDIIPVVAEEYPVTDEISVPTRGIDKLCASTLECVDTAKQINEENRKRMILEQKNLSAKKHIAYTATTAAVVGAIPITFADTVILIPLEKSLTKSILKIYDVQLSDDLINIIIGSAAITNLAKSLITPFKALPIAGAVINGVIAAVIVWALGEAVNQLGKNIYTGKIDPEQVNNVKEFVEDKINENKVVAAVVAYLQENAGKLKGKSAKEIFSSAMEAAFKKDNGNNAQ